MSNSFLERRKAQLVAQGREDLAREISTLQKPASVETPADIPLGDRVGLWAEPESEDRRPLHEVIAFISDTLLSFDFGISSRARSIANNEVRSMSLEECEYALRNASVQGIQTKPGYYTALLNRVDANKDFFYRDLVTDVTELGVFLHRHFPRGVTVWSADRETVARMNSRELHEALVTASPEKVRTRGSFYTALYHHIMHKNT